MGGEKKLKIAYKRRNNSVIPSRQGSKKIMFTDMDEDRDEDEAKSDDMYLPA